jgi:hypothetical protein
MVPETRLGVRLDRDDHDCVGVHVYCIFHSTDDAPCDVHGGRQQTLTVEIREDET